MARLSIEERFWSKVEKTEGCWNWTGATNSSPKTPGRAPYGSFWGGTKTRTTHRFAYELMVGEIPEGMEVDHICHNTLCVRPEHLRSATHKQNGENKAGAASNSKSGIRGVSWNRQNKRWVAKVVHNGHDYTLGNFMDIRDAEAAVIAKRKELYTHNEIDRRSK